MSRPSLGQVERSMSSLTLGTVKKIEERRKQIALEGVIERDEVFKIAVSGVAETLLAWQEVEVKFGTTFIDVSGQRDFPFDRPIFTYGHRITSPHPVGLTACVMEWMKNDEGTTGCLMAIGVLPGDDPNNPRSFKGELHAVFTGYGMPVDVYDAESQDIA